MFIINAKLLILFKSFRDLINIIIFPNKHLRYLFNINLEFSNQTNFFFTWNYHNIKN